MKCRCRIKYVLLLMVLAVVSAPLVAQSNEVSFNEVYHFLNNLTNEFNIVIDSKEFDQLREKNYGYGEIAIAYGMAAESGHSVDYIMHLREDEKMGWGKIGKTLGIKVSDVLHRSKKVCKNSNFERDSDHIQIIIDGVNHEHKNSDNHNNSGNHGKANKH